MGKAQTAWDRMAQDEAKALSTMLESPSCKVMIIVIAAHDDEDGTVAIAHACSDGTNGRHLRQFIMGVQRKLDWLNDKLFKRA